MSAICNAYIGSGFGRYSCTEPAGHYRDWDSDFWHKNDTLTWGDEAEDAIPATNGAVDPVNHPPHYTAHPSGIECIQITEHMNFCLGNALKCIWRAGLKGDEIEDLRKAAWYLNREIELREKK